MASVIMGGLIGLLCVCGWVLACMCAFLSLHVSLVLHAYSCTCETVSLRASVVKGKLTVLPVYVSVWIVEHAQQLVCKDM